MKKNSAHSAEWILSKTKTYATLCAVVQRASVKLVQRLRCERNVLEFHWSVSLSPKDQSFISTLLRKVALSSSSDVSSGKLPLYIRCYKGHFRRDSSYEVRPEQLEWLTANNMAMLHLSTSSKLVL